MRITFNAKIIKIYDSTLRGNKFEIQPILFEHENKNYYLEAVGMYSHLINGFNENDFVEVTADINSYLSKENKYWTNVNVVDIKNLDKKIEEDPKNDLPF